MQMRKRYENWGKPARVEKIVHRLRSGCRGAEAFFPRRKRPSRNVVTEMKTD